MNRKGQNISGTLTYYIKKLFLFIYSSCFQVVSEGEDVIDMERTKNLLDTSNNQRLKDLLNKYEIIDIEVRLV